MATTKRRPHPARGARRAVGVASTAGLVALTTGMAVGAALAPSASGTLQLQQRPQPRTAVAVGDSAGYSGDDYYSGAVPSNTAAPQPIPGQAPQPQYQQPQPQYQQPQYQQPRSQPITVTRGS